MDKSTAMRDIISKYYNPVKHMSDKPEDWEKWNQLIRGYENASQFTQKLLIALTNEAVVPGRNTGLKKDYMSFAEIETVLNVCYKAYVHNTSVDLPKSRFATAIISAFGEA